MNTLAATSSTPYYPGLDLLRFVCVIWLVVYHLMYWISGIEYRVWGIYSVCIFFTISGASIHSGYADKVANSKSIRNFFIGRLTRLMPLFLLALAIEVGGFDAQLIDKWVAIPGCDNLTSAGGGLGS